MTNAARELPQGWIWSTLGEEFDVIMGQSPPSHTYNVEGKGLPFFQGKAEFGPHHPTPVKWCSEPGKIAQPGDVLISVRAPVGPTNLCVEESCIGRGLAAIRPKNNAPSQYMLYWLKLTDGQLAEQATGTTFAAISGATLRNHPIPIAPLPEQRRIVAKIEELFSRLDAGVAALKRVQAALKRYKASVLKAACEGRLVPQDPSDEPADVLLERVMAESHSKQESELLSNGMRSATSKDRQADSSRNKGARDLPPGWCLSSIGQITECLDHRRQPINKKTREQRIGPIPYYGANGQVGWIDRFLFDEPLVLVVEDETFTGREKPFCYKVEGRSWVNNHAHVLRATQATSIDFLNYALAFYPFTPLTTGTTGRKKLTKKALMEAPIAVPPLSEQARIVKEIDRRSSFVTNLEADLNTNLARAARLRQAILAQAFSGKLVQQDAQDARSRHTLDETRPPSNAELLG